MKKVLIYSIPFGFGPTGKAIAIANEISLISNVTIATFGHALKIIGDAEMTIIDCKSRDFKSWDKDLFKNVDVVISVMDLRLINYVNEYYPIVKTIFVDSLFWWRKSLADIPFDKCDLFLVQTFPGVKENLENVPFVYRDKFVEVSPILPDYELKKGSVDRDKNILLHFGGVNSLIAEWEMYREYFEFLTGAAINSLGGRNIKLVVTGNFELMRYLKSFFEPNSGVEFKCLDNQAFHEQLVDTEIFITTCGIEATYEAFMLDVPTLFLAPVNSTQLYQLMAFLNLDFPAIISDEFITIFSDVINAKFEYMAETSEIAKSLKLLLSISGCKQKLEDKLNFLLNTILQNSIYREDMLLQQRRFIDQPVQNWLTALFSFLADTGTSKRIEDKKLAQSFYML